MISFSIHGPSVNDYIGSDTFNNIVKDATSSFIQPSNQKIGLTAFGGITGGNATHQLLTLTNGDASDVANAIDAMTIDYANNYGNLASKAIDIANAELRDEAPRQKYHVIFTATLPLINGKGSSTTPSDIDDICGQWTSKNHEEGQADVSKERGM